MSSWPDFVLESVTRYCNASSAAALSMTASWLDTSALSASQCERLWPHSKVQCSKTLREANAHYFVDGIIIVFKSQNDFFLDGLDLLATRLYTKAAVIRRWCKSKGIIITRKKTISHKKLKHFPSALREVLVSFVQWKTCRQCYSLRTAIVATEFILECHHCSARTNCKQEHNCLTRWLKRIDWDDINSLPADWGIVWHSDISDDAKRARAGEHSSLIRNLYSLSLGATTSSHSSRKRDAGMPLYASALSIPS